MTISRKLLTVATIAGLTLSGSAVAQAQSSSLFSGLSSSTVSTSPSVEELQNELRETLIKKLEDQGHTLTEGANESAQDGAERLAGGESPYNLEAGYIPLNSVPHILLGAYIEEIEKMGHLSIHPTEVGVGMASTAYTTYVVLYAESFNNGESDYEGELT